MQTVESINLITRNPEIRGGRPCIIGTGLRVTDIVVAMRYHTSALRDQIADGFQVSLAQVYAALAYYNMHKDDIDADIVQQIKKARELKDKAVGSRRPSLLS